MLSPQLLGPVVPMHGLGGGKDLPIPAPLAITGGSAALVISFCVLLLAWRTSRYAGPELTDEPGRRVPTRMALVVNSAPFPIALRALGLIFGGYFIWALVAGPDLAINPALGSFYVLLWVGLVPASLLFGRIFRALSPVRTIHILFARTFGGDPARGLIAYPEKLGYWPAAFGLFAFVWQELVNADSVYTGSVRLWLAYYLAIMLGGAAVFGDRWISRADPFEVYSDLLAKLSPWARSNSGTLVWRTPLANLATLRPQAGLPAVVAVLLGSTAFDSYKDSVAWIAFLTSRDTDVEILNTLGLAGFCLVAWFGFCVATMATRTDANAEHPTLIRQLPGLFAHSVIPVIVGYMTAHYISYLFEVGQQTLVQLSDPMVDGSNLLGTANWSVNYWLTYNPTALATIKVIAVVAGHIVGVVAAHDRALRLLPAKHQITGQIGLLLLMVGITLGGLYLLFGA